MRRSTLQVLMLLGVMLPVLLMVANAPTAAQGLTGVTPTIGVGPGTPVPVGGHLMPVDRGAVLQATFGSLILPVAGLLLLVCVIGFVTLSRRLTA